MYGHRFYFVGILWIIVDYRKPGKGMPMSKKQRKRREIDIEDAAAEPLTRLSIKRAVTYILVLDLSVPWSLQPG
jgi:hypothetical protein